MSSNHGKFVWYELMTSDPVAAEKFYQAVVGWGAQDSGMPGMRYTMMTAGKMPVAGVMAVPADAAAMGAKPSWLGYIHVDDVDKSAEALKQAGGTVYRPPSDIPTVGRFAVVADPQGAGFCLFHGTPTEPMPEVAPNTPGHGGWHELMAADGAKAFDFYAKMFGWTKDHAMDMGAMGTYQIFAQNGVQIGGMMTKPPAVPMPYWGYYFNVDGIDAAAARVTAGGGKIANGPMEVPGGSWIVQCNDPQGVYFALVAPHR